MKIYGYEVKPNADLRGAVLRNVNFSDMNLRSINFNGADLSDSIFYSSNLRYADFSNTNLNNTDFNGANLRYAYFRGAKITNSNFGEVNLADAVFDNTLISNVDFSKANFTHTTFRYTDLNDSKLPNYKICPEEGSFIAYKKAGKHIITVEIPAGSKRTSCLRSRKCRAEFVKVLDIKNEYDEKIGYEVEGNFDEDTKYKIGEITKADKFNDDIKVDCSNGIHFFVTKKEAMDW